MLNTVENSSSNSPDNQKKKNKNISAINMNRNNTNFSSVGNYSQNNFNYARKGEINTPKNPHSNRMLLIDSSKDIRSKIKFIKNKIIYLFFSLIFIFK